MGALAPPFLVPGSAQASTLLLDMEMGKDAADHTYWDAAADSL